MSARRIRLSGLARIALMPPAALLVHQLRFMLAFGGGATLELQRQGHAYLHSSAPWIVFMLALATGAFLRSLGRALAGQTSSSRYTISFAGLWMACSVCLVAIYVAQELLEGALATGHQAGLVGVFGYGGWWAVPAALSVGLVLAAVFHGARWALHEIARRCVRASRARMSDTRPRPTTDPLLRRPSPLAGGWSGRGPPR